MLDSEEKDGHTHHLELKITRLFTTGAILLAPAFRVALNKPKDDLRYDSMPGLIYLNFKGIRTSRTATFSRDSTINHKRCRYSTCFAETFYLT
jgi:hypothetical protein